MESGGNGVHRNLTCAMCHRAPFTDYIPMRGVITILDWVFMRQHLVKKPMRHLWRVYGLSWSSGREGCAYIRS